MIPTLARRAVCSTQGAGATPPLVEVYKSPFHPDYSDTCLRQWANSQTNYPNKTPQPLAQWA